MRLCLTIGSKFKTQEDFEKKVKLLHPDDVVFSIDIKNENNDSKVVHLDFAEFDYHVIDGDIVVRVKSFGGNWDELNEKEGLSQEDITNELLSTGYVDNYVILAELKDEYKTEFSEEDFTKDGLYKDFKLLEIGYIDENGKKILFNIDENAPNAEGC